MTTSASATIALHALDRAISLGRAARKPGITPAAALVLMKQRRESMARYHVACRAYARAPSTSTADAHALTRLVVDKLATAHAATPEEADVLRLSAASRRTYNALRTHIRMDHTRALATVKRWARQDGDPPTRAA